MLHATYQVWLKVAVYKDITAEDLVAAVVGSYLEHQHLIRDLMNTLPVPETAEQDVCEQIELF